MEEEKADELAQQVVQLHGPDARGSEREMHRVFEGVAFEVADAIPATAKAAVIQREDNEAIVLAIAEDRVWVIEPHSPENEIEPVMVTTSVLRLDPGRDRVRRDSRHRKRADGGRYAFVTWYFEIAGRSFEIAVAVGIDGDHDPRGRLAHSLAAALGWHFPPDVGAYRIDAV